jgi:hypothetical protein
VKKPTRRTVRPDWGTVKVIGGSYEGRIGYLDDEEDRSGIVYFGDLFFAPRYYLIPFKYLAPVSTDDLMRRREELFQLISMPNSREPYGRLDNAEDHIEHLTEYALVQGGSDGPDVYGSVNEGERQACVYIAFLQRQTICYLAFS